MGCTVAHEPRHPSSVCTRRSRLLRVAQARHLRRGRLNSPNITGAGARRREPDLRRGPAAHSGRYDAARSWGLPSYGPSPAPGCRTVESASRARIRCSPQRGWPVLRDRARAPHTRVRLADSRLPSRATRCGYAPCSQRLRVTLVRGHVAAGANPECGESEPASWQIAAQRRSSRAGRAFSAARSRCAMSSAPPLPSPGRVRSHGTAYRVLVCNRGRLWLGISDVVGDRARHPPASKGRIDRLMHLAE